MRIWRRRSSNGKAVTHRALAAFGVLALAAAGCSDGTDTAVGRAADPVAVPVETGPDGWPDAVGSPLVAPDSRSPVQLAGAGDCAGLESVTTVSTDGGCAEATSEHGRFAVTIEERPAASHAVIYRFDDTTRTPQASLVRISAPLNVNATSANADFARVTVRALTIADTQVIVVTYEPVSAHEPPPLFDVVEWRDDADAPTVTLHIEATRGAQLDGVGKSIVVTQPDYSDGAPGCCPTAELERTFTPASEGWTESSLRSPT